MLLDQEIVERRTDAESGNDDDDEETATAASNKTIAAADVREAEPELFALRDLPETLTTLMLFNQCKDLKHHRLAGVISLEGCSDERLAAFKLCASETRLRMGPVSKSLASKMRRCALDGES